MFINRWLKYSETTRYLVSEEAVLVKEIDDLNGKILAMNVAAAEPEANREHEIDTVLNETDGKHFFLCMKSFNFYNGIFYIILEKFFNLKYLRFNLINY
jgi:hypothetical protein